LLFCYQLSREANWWQDVLLAVEEDGELVAILSVETTGDEEEEEECVGDECFFELEDEEETEPSQLETLAAFSVIVADTVRGTAVYCVSGSPPMS
jgi:hypothetical protein